MDEQHPAFPPEPPDPPAADQPDEQSALGAYSEVMAAVRADAVLLPVRLNKDATAAWRNCRAGTKAVLALQPTIAQELPHTNWGLIASGPKLALALVGCVALLKRTAGSASDVGKLYGEIAPLRGLLLDSASALARKGLVDAAAVAAIRKGTGNVDAAQDCLALVHLFRGAAAKLAGKTCVEESDLLAAETKATALLAAIGVKAPGQAGELAGDRDLLWAAVNRAYDAALKVAKYQWGDAWADHAPPLGQG